MNNADWWSKKLGNPAPVPQGRPDPSPMMPPSQQPMAQMPVFQQPQTTKAQSASQNNFCPDCGSGNYMAPNPQIALRCYDCGYPISQSGSRFGGLAGAHVEGAAKQASGNDATNNWNPQGIIGRINE
jgi:ribosomal protein S27AE